MGTNFTSFGALALDAANGRSVSVELPLVAFRPFDPCDLRSGSVEIISTFTRAELSDPRYSVPWARRFDGNCNAGVGGGRLVRFSIGLDFCRALCVLVLVGGFF